MRAGFAQNTSWGHLAAVLVVSLVLTLPAFIGTSETIGQATTAGPATGQPGLNPPSSTLPTRPPSTVGVETSTQPAIVTLGVIVDSLTPESRDSEIYRGLQWAIIDQAELPEIQVAGRPTSFAISKAEVDGTASDAINATAVFVADRSVDFVVGSIGADEVDMGTILTTKPFEMWEQQGSKGDNPAVINSVQDDDAPGESVLQVALNGHSRTFRTFKIFPYDGVSQIGLKFRTKIIRHESPGGAYVYLRGRKADGKEVARIYYTLLENWDSKTSSPDENRGYYTVRTDFPEPELGVWIENSVLPVAQFEKEFPGVWESLRIASLELELSAWTDNAVTVRFGEPSLRVENGIRSPAGIQVVTEPSGNLLLAYHELLSPLAGDNTFIVMPSTLATMQAVYTSLEEAHPEVGNIAIIRLQARDFLETEIIREVISNTFALTGIKMTSEVPYVIDMDGLAESLAPALETNPSVLDLGNLSFDDQTRIIAAAGRSGFNGFVVSYNAYGPGFFGHVDLDLNQIKAWLLPGVEWSNPDVPRPLQQLAENYLDLFDTTPSLDTAFAHEIILPSLIKALESADSGDSASTIAGMATASWNTAFGKARFILGGEGVSSQVSVLIPVSEVSQNGVMFLGLR
jgi:hypothetical protein